MLASPQRFRRQVVVAGWLGDHLSRWPCWTPDELALMGTAPDAEIAQRIGKTVEAVPGLTWGRFERGFVTSARVNNLDVLPHLTILQLLAPLETLDLSPITLNPQTATQVASLPQLQRFRELQFGALTAETAVVLQESSSLAHVMLRSGGSLLTNTDVLKIHP